MPPLILDPLYDTLFRMEEEHELKGWHGDAHVPPPSLYFIHAPATGGRYVWYELPVPPGLWGMFEWPHHAMRLIADRIDSGMAPYAFALADPLVGVAVIFEAWLVATDQRGIEEATKMANVRMLYQHPRRVSVRMAHCACLDGRSAQINRFQGDSTAKKAADHLDGDMADALRYFAEILKKHCGGR